MLLACEVTEDAAQLPRPPPTAANFVAYAAYGRLDPRQAWAVGGERCVPGRPAAGFHGVRWLGFWRADAPPPPPPPPHPPRPRAVLPLPS